MDLVEEGREEAARSRVCETTEDDARIDLANAIQEGGDPEADFLPADEGCVVRGLIAT